MIQGQQDWFAGVVPFIAVVEEKTFRAAGARLGCSTAAVSKAVLSLEARLGVTLLQRGPRGASPTAEGEAFYRRAHEAVSGLLAARDEATASRAAPKGPLHVSLSFVVAPLFVDGLDRFLARYPRVEPRLSFTDRMARFAEDRVDASVRVGGHDEPSLVVRKLADTRWVTVASPSYLARQGAIQRVEDLANHRCLCFVMPNGTQRPWSFAFDDAAKSVPVAPAVLVDQGEHLPRMALAGLGVTQVLDFMVRPAIAKGELVEVLSPHSAQGPSIRLVSTRERARSANVRALVQWAKELF
jgi:LysR family transcriptional regulator for bpeEF and oprC